MKRRLTKVAALLFGVAIVLIRYPDPGTESTEEHDKRDLQAKSACFQEHIVCPFFRC